MQNTLSLDSLEVISNSYNYFKSNLALISAHVRILTISGYGEFLRALQKLIKCKRRYVSQLHEYGLNVLSCKSWI